MPINFECPHCRTRLKVATRKAGTAAQCPKCRGEIRIPGGPPRQPAVPPPAPAAPAGSAAALPERLASPESAAKPPAPAAHVPGPPAESTSAADSPADDTTPLEPSEPPAPAAHVPGPSAELPSAAESLADATTPVEPSEPMADGGQTGPRARVIRPPEMPFDGPLTEFVVYDDESELVYELEEGSGDAASLPVGFDPDRIAVSRRVLYLQGLLLAVVSLGSLAIGILVGRTMGDPPVVETAFPRPCLLTGTVTYAGGDASERPDRGAVAIVVPRDLHPDEKIQLVGLRPQDARPDDDDPGVQALRGLGGDYCRADVEGRFWLRVPDRGSYFLLFISAARSQQEADPPRQQLAEIGRFFLLTPDLFGGHSYAWREEPVPSDRTFSIRFP